MKERDLFSKKERLQSKEEELRLHSDRPFLLMQPIETLMEQTNLFATKKKEEQTTQIMIEAKDQRQISLTTHQLQYQRLKQAQDFNFKKRKELERITMQNQIQLIQQRYVIHNNLSTILIEKRQDKTNSDNDENLTFAQKQIYHQKIQKYIQNYRQFLAYQDKIQQIQILLLRNQIIKKGIKRFKSEIQQLQQQKQQIKTKSSLKKIDQEQIIKIEKKIKLTLGQIAEYEEKLREIRKKIIELEKYQLNS